MKKIITKKLSLKAVRLEQIAAVSAADLAGYYTRYEERCLPPPPEPVSDAAGNCRTYTPSRYC